MKNMLRNKCINMIAVCVLAFCAAFLIWPETVEAVSAPTGLKQTQGDQTGVEVAWDTMFGTDDMNIYLRISSTADFSVCSVHRAYGTEEYIWNLQAGKSYYVQVGFSSSYDYTSSAAPADTAWSSAIEVVTAPKSVVSDTIVQTAATETSISVAWAAAEGATAYKVEYWRNGTSSDTAAKTTTANPTVTLTGLDKDMEYNVRIYPIRANGTFSAESSSGSIKGSIPTLPTQIIGLECNYFNPVSSSRVYMSLDWDRNVVADGYEYEIYKYNGKSALVKGTYTSNCCSIENSKIKANQVYKIRVRAYIDTVSTGRTYGTWSDYEYASRCASKGTKIQKVGNKLKVSWKKTTGAKGYTVYMSSKNNGTYKKMGTTKKTSMTLKKAIKKGNYYYIRIVPYYQKGKAKYHATINSTSQSSGYAWYASSGRLYSYAN